MNCIDGCIFYLLVLFMIGLVLFLLSQPLFWAVIGFLCLIVLIRAVATSRKEPRPFCPVCETRRNP